MEGFCNLDRRKPLTLDNTLASSRLALGSGIAAGERAMHTSVAGEAGT
jgi:hypothetical protein